MDSDSIPPALRATSLSEREASPAAPPDGALAWARAHGIVSAPDADAPATLGDLARALHHYHRAFGAKEAQP